MIGYRYSRWSFVIFPLFLGSIMILNHGLRDRNHFQTEKNGPIIVDIGPVYSFRTSNLSAVGQYTNTTGKKIKILEKHVSCGCLKAEPDKQELLPGETLNMSIETLVPATMATRSLTAILTTDSIEKPQIAFDFRFTAVPRLFSATEAIDFGTIDEYSNGDTLFDLVIRRHFFSDENEECDFDVKSSSRDLDCFVERRTCSKPEVGVRWDEWVVKVVRKESAKNRIGPRTESIEIKLESGESIKIPVTWNRKSHVTLIPSVVNFGSIPRGEVSNAKKLRINFSPGHFKNVRSIDTSDDISYLNQESTETSLSWSLRFDSKKSKVDGHQSGKLVFIFEDGSSIESRWFGSITNGL